MRCWRQHAACSHLLLKHTHRRSRGSRRNHAACCWDTTLLEAKKPGPQILAAVNELLQRKGLLLCAGTVIDATLIAAPSSTRNRSGERDLEMHQSKKGQQWYFGMKSHIGVDAESGLVHTVWGTAVNISDPMPTRG